MLDMHRYASLCARSGLAKFGDRVGDLPVIGLAAELVRGSIVLCVRVTAVAAIALLSSRLTKPDQKKQLSLHRWTLVERHARLEGERAWHRLIPGMAKRNENFDCYFAWQMGRTVVEIGVADVTERRHFATFAESAGTESPLLTASRNQLSDTLRVLLECGIRVRGDDKKTILGYLLAGGMRERESIARLGTVAQVQAIIDAHPEVLDNIHSLELVAGLKEWGLVLHRERGTDNPLQNACMTGVGLEELLETATQDEIKRAFKKLWLATASAPETYCQAWVDRHQLLMGKMANPSSCGSLCSQIERMIRSKPDLNGILQTHFGEACVRGDMQVILSAIQRELLVGGTSFQYPLTALLLTKARKECILEVIKRCNGQHKTPNFLTVICRSGQTDVLRLLLQAISVDELRLGLGTRMEDLCTYACREGHAQVVATLLENGLSANPGLSKGEYQKHYLWIACQAGDRALISVLLRYKESLESAYEVLAPGDEPLLQSLCRNMENKDIICELLQVKPAIARVEGPDGKKAIWTLVEYHQAAGYWIQDLMDIVQTLIASDPDVDLCEVRGGVCLLHRVLERCPMQLASLLFTHMQQQGQPLLVDSSIWSETLCKRHGLLGHMEMMSVLKMVAPRMSIFLIPLLWEVCCQGEEGDGDRARDAVARGIASCMRNHGVHFDPTSLLNKPVSEVVRLAPCKEQLASTVATAQGKNDVDKLLTFLDEFPKDDTWAPSRGQATLFIYSLSLPVQQRLVCMQYCVKYASMDEMRVVVHNREYLTPFLKNDYDSVVQPLLDKADPARHAQGFKKLMDALLGDSSVPPASVLQLMRGLFEKRLDDPTARLVAALQHFHEYFKGDIFYQRDVVRLCIEGGADVNQPFITGARTCSPLKYVSSDIAYTSGSILLFRMLEQAGGHLVPTDNVLLPFYRMTEHEWSTWCQIIGDLYEKYRDERGTPSRSHIQLLERHCFDSWKGYYGQMALNDPERIGAHEKFLHAFRDGIPTNLLTHFPILQLSPLNMLTFTSDVLKRRPEICVEPFHKAIQTDSSISVVDSVTLQKKSVDAESLPFTTAVWHFQELVKHLLDGEPTRAIKRTPEGLPHIEGLGTGNRDGFDGFYSGIGNHMSPVLCLEWVGNVVQKFHKQLANNQLFSLLDYILVLPQGVKEQYMNMLEHLHQMPITGRGTDDEVFASPERHLTYLGIFVQYFGTDEDREMCTRVPELSEDQLATLWERHGGTLRAALCLVRGMHTA